MRSRLSPAARFAMLKGTFSWQDGEVRVGLVPRSIEPLVSDAMRLTYLELRRWRNGRDLPRIRAGLIGDRPLVSRTEVNGACDAADVCFGRVDDFVTGVFIYALDRGGIPLLLIAGDHSTGLPIVPSGAEITVVWDGPPNYIFRCP